MPQPERVLLAGGGEPAGRVLLDRVQQPVAGLAAQLVVEGDQRLVDERGHQVEHGAGRDLLVRADLLGHLQVPAGEHRQPAQQDLLRLGQQLVAPVHRGAQRLLPRRRGPVARGQQPEPVIEPAGDLLHRQRADPRRGQLDGQRHAVQGPAQPGHRLGVVAAQREAGPGRRRPARRTAAAPRAGPGRPGTAGSRPGRHGQRRDPPDGLAAHPQRLPAGRDHPQRRAAGQQLLHQRRRTRPRRARRCPGRAAAAGPAAPRPGSPISGRSGSSRIPKRGGDPPRDQVRVGRVGQLHQPGPVGKLRDQVAGQPHGQAGLADAARAAQGQGADVAEQQRELAQVALPADEAVRLRRKVARGRGSCGSHGIEDRLVDGGASALRGRFFHSQMSTGTLLV